MRSEVGWNPWSLLTKPLPSLLISGDFNFAFMKSWDSDNQAALRQAIKERMGDGLTAAQDKIQAGLLLDLSDEFMLNQVIQEPTREGSILDLIFFLITLI